MIGKVCQRGSDVRRLLGYLFREGLAGQHGLSALHSDAHLIAAWDGVDGLVPPRNAAGGRDLGTVAAALNAPLLAAGLGRGEWKQARPVYHLAISAAETDRTLSDEEWADVVDEYLHRIGLAPRGDEEAVRWVAVRHADNHVHVVATLARQDGKRVWPRNDFYRAREASLAVEARYGLTRTSPADRTGDRQTSRAEQRRHARQVEQRAERGRPAPAGPDREVLRAKVRAALAGSNSFTEFSERLSRDGVLVRPRMSTLDPEEVTGYAVALRASGDAAEGIEPVWFGGGKLAPDLTLPQLKARWCREGTDARQAPVGARTTRGGVELGPSERQALWDAAGQAIGRAEEQLRAAAGGDPAARAMAEAAAVAASEVLAAVGRLTERSGAGPIHRAAEVYDRAARGLRRRPPIPTGPARRTRRAAGGLRGMEFVRTADTRQLLQTLDQLSKLSHTLAALREQQGRTAQAAAARRAAELLTAEQTRRTHAAYATVVRGRTATPETTRTTGSRPTQGPFLPPFSWPGRPARPAPASRPGRVR